MSKAVNSKYTVNNAGVRYLLARLLDLLQEGVVRDRALHNDLLLLEAYIIAVDAEACMRQLPVSD